MSTFPEPDRDELRRFIETAFRNADLGSFLALRAFRDDLNQSWRPDLWASPKIAGSGLDNIVDEAFRLAGHAARAEVPVCFAAPVASFRSPAGAAEADVVCGPVLSVECDEHPLRARERLEGVLGPATLIVASGGEYIDSKTGEIEAKLHCHWGLATPARTFPELVQLKEARRIATLLVDGDATGAPPSHPYRWPGSWHRKGAPTLARVVEFRPDITIDLDDAFAQLDAAWRAAQPHPVKRTRRKAVRAAQGSLFSGGPAATAGEPQAQLADIAAALEAVPNPDVAWSEWNRLGMCAYAASGGSLGGFRLFVRWSKKSGKYRPDRTKAKWRNFQSSPPTKLGAGTLFFEARQYQPGWRKPSDLVLEPPPADGPEGRGAHSKRGEATDGDGLRRCR